VAFKLENTPFPVLCVFHASPLVNSPVHFLSVEQQAKHAITASTVHQQGK